MIEAKEPVGIMFCLDCMYKHSRDLEHHLEDAVRVTKGKERNDFENMIDTVRGIRGNILKKIKAAPEEGCDVCSGSDPGSNPGACPAGMEKTDHYCAETIAPMKEFDPKSIRTVVQDGHRVVIGCPKGKYDKVAQRCTVGTRAHKILHPIGE